MDSIMKMTEKRSMSCKVGGAANALSLCRDNNRLVVAGRSLLKIFAIDESSSEFNEIKNLHSGSSRRQGLNMSSSDVAWCPNDENLIATAATNGAVVAWDLNTHARNKQLVVFSEHQRTVTKVSFHPVEAPRLISGSQDGSMKMFDLRKKDCTNTFYSRSDGVRNVQFSPFNHYQFAASFDNGNVQIWDYRRVNSAMVQVIAHKGSVYTLDWHPSTEEKNTLATGGRDNMVKIWDVSNTAKSSTNIPTTSSVASVCWRPSRPEQLATAAMMLDFSINVWDLRRRFVPFAYFDAHRDIPTGIKWKHSDPSILFSCSKDGVLYMHTMQEAVRPGDNTETRGLDISSLGCICLADDSLTINSPRPQSPSGYNRTGIFGAFGKLSGSGALSSGDFDDVLPSLSSGSSNKMKKFLKTQSALKMLRGKPITITPCQDLNDYLEQRDTVTEHLFMSRFRYAAKNYKLYSSSPDASFSVVCQHNSDVALDAGMANAARTWLLLSQFYLNNKGANPCNNTNTNAGPIPRTYSDVTTDKAKRGDGDSKRLSLVHKKDESHGSQTFNLATSGAESEFHFEDERNEIEDYLTDIAKGRHSEPGFYISDDDPIPSFTYDGGTSEADFLTDQEWGSMRVPSEAIIMKEDLDTESIAKFGHVDAPSAVINQSTGRKPILYPHGGRWSAVPNREEASSSPSPPADVDAHLITEKDMEVKPSLWPDPVEAFRDDLFSQQLRWFAVNNDVQTSVSIMLTLSSFSIACNFSIDEASIEQWQLSYLNLLAKHELWVQHEEVVKLSKLPSIRALSTSSTVQISCRTCQRRLPFSNSWSCDRRGDQDHGNKAVSCFLCNLPVTGLYTYCQGCNFGGHSKCVEAWMKGRILTCKNHCI